MRRAVLAAALLLAGPAAAQAPLDNPAAFERGFAVSLWQFDACGDALAGRMFRQALAERFARCPFTETARRHYQQWTRAEMQLARQKMTARVEEHGGLPAQVEGMPGTCRAHQSSELYRSFRTLLERYSEGDAPAEAVLPAACDAADILP
ncbi:hypothetical protein [Paracraurococcus lichenis]|uniref:DUF1311 domain-containing protein n=1 Tax=Paracraurococcus lichenis TaxID=3064888 RepID=A0ABT9E4Q1_9PROT|nr:hypothetical protein [Paracraurococcus sp. LOR1-02]MDO9711138.1 hypothetical protein [Paracraurococcus sp. LOR1-02]